jgi:hypothetical protein
VLPARTSELFTPIFSSLKALIQGLKTPFPVFNTFNYGFCLSRLSICNTYRKTDHRILLEEGFSRQITFTKCRTRNGRIQAAAKDLLAISCIRHDKFF